jgi:2-dehydro-3-deoxy-D-gluconate 5-dehydrogenase
MPSLRLDGRTALVTGGSRGLGLGIALALAHAGADIALCSRSREDLESASELVRRTGRRTTIVPADLQKQGEAKRAVREAATHFGRLDILVNGAGINIRQPATSFDENDWQRLMSINLESAFFACQEAAAIMRVQGKGKIVSIGSVAFEVALPNIALYAISKGGMRQMTKALAVEWAKDRINVNAIAPGRFWTQLTDAVFREPDLYDSAVGVIPMGRPGLPADLAGAAVLLASDASDYITGQTIVVDGGWLAGGGVKA